mgnify:CR=1 FL=1
MNSNNFCELCNMRVRNNHYNTSGHMTRERYLDPNIITKCDICRMGFLRPEGYDGHINSNLHLQNIQNQNTIPITQNIIPMTTQINDNYDIDPNQINLDLLEYLNQHQNEILNQINNSIFPIKFILDIRLRFTVANPGNEHTPEDEIWGAIKNDPYLVYSRLYELPQDLINDLLRKFDEECLTGASNKRLIEIYLADVEIFSVNGLGGSAFYLMHLIQIV